MLEFESQPDCLYHSIRFIKPIEGMTASSVSFTDVPGLDLRPDDVRLPSGSMTSEGPQAWSLKLVKVEPSTASPPPKQTDVHPCANRVLRRVTMAPHVRTTITGLRFISVRSGSVAQIWNNPSTAGTKRSARVGVVRRTKNKTSIRGCI